MTDAALWPKVMAHLIRVECAPHTCNADDPHDRGGRTRTGITQHTFDRWMLHHQQPSRDVWTMTDAERDAIYEAEFWIAGRCDLIAAGSERLALAHMDACVNHGVVGKTPKGTVIGANPKLQRVLGVTPDGVIGPRTLGALAAAIRKGLEGTLLESYLAVRLAFYARLIANDPTQAKFDHVWKERIAVVRRDCLALPDAATVAAELAA